MADDEQNALQISEVAATHERSLVAYVAHLLGRAEGAHDVVQEAFSRLCEPRHAGVALPEWLFVVCRNLAIDRMRDQAKKERRMSALSETAIHTIPNDQSDPPMRLVRADESRRLLDLLASLPPRQQEAVRLKFQQGLSYAQIATVMETNANNVAALIHTGLKALRERMTD
jgi:RNA polymerase sigma factor (sigma-70 family)